ncbi:MAG: T9SS type A sorting domain-containing protein, partial [Bacteroidales bacterium]|nr:T9SS type A sorting domain-containing protein [Bacteroidales bacterium]
NFRISYIPCCLLPTSITAYANGSSSNSVCPNSPANIANLTVGNITGGGCACGDWRYAWSNGSLWWNGTAFSSSSAIYNNAYSSINTNVSSTTTYTLRIDCSSSVCGGYISDDVTVNLYSQSVAANSISGTTAICPGGSTILSVNGGSLGTGANWIWYTGSCGGTQVGTGSSITVSPSSNTTYFVRAVGTCNTTTCVSTTVTIQTLSSPAASASASPSTINAGGNSTLTLSGGSLGTNAEWVWYIGSCGGTQIGTGTSISVSPTVNTTYYVSAQGTCNTTSCVSVTVSVTGTVTICNGEKVDLSIVGGSLGTDANWVWYTGSCGETQVGTGTSISNVAPTVNTTYYVRAEGTCNNSECTSISVIVNYLSSAASSISGTNSQICAGGSSTLSVVGGTLGTGASWQWYSSSCGGSYIGSGSSINVTPNVNTTYYVRAEGACNTTTCVSYSVTVSPDPIVSISSNTTNICTGGAVDFTQTVSGGSGTIINQWEHSSDGSNWSAWTTSSNPTYSNLASSMYFRCVRTATDNGCNDGISNTIYVSVAPDPIISLQPISPDPICIGGTTASITTSAEDGTGSFSYQWQYNNGGSWVNVSNGSPSGAIYSGATGSNFFVAGISISGEYEYRCNINQSGNGCGQLTTNTIIVDVKEDPTVSISGDATICSGGTASLLANESGGAGTFTYQWERSSNETEWSSISGATNALYTTPALTSTMHYHVILTASGSGCGSATSNTETVTVIADPAITTQPTGGTICTDGSINLSVVATGGTPSLTYQWYNSGGAISGATSATYSANTASNYYCIVSASGDGCGSATSSTVTVTVVADPAITTHPIGATICSGATHTMSVVASGGTPSLTYQWYRNGSSISGATSTSYGATTTGTYYCIVSASGSGCGTAQTNTATVTVDPSSDGGTASANPSGVICASQSIELALTGYTGIIQWQTNASGSWADISGENSSSYNTPVLLSSTEYRAELTSGVCGAVNSNIVTVTVTTPSISAINGNDYVWTGTNSAIWDGATTNNWLRFISGTNFEIPISVPGENDNVFIRATASCFNTPPIVNTENIAKCKNLTIDNGNTLNLNANSNLKIHGNINNNGILNVNGTSKIDVSGNWTNTGTFTAGTGTVAFTGSSPQTITTNGETFNNVVINNAGAGNADIIIATDLRINELLTLTNGVVSFTYSNRQVILTSSASSTAGNTNSFVAGIVEKSGTSAFTFPVGRDNVWAPVRIAAPAALSKITAEYKTEPGPLNWSAAYMCDQNELHHTSGVEHWLLTTNASTPAVTLYWKDAVRSGIQDLADLRVAHYNETNSCWENKGGIVDGTLTSGSITSTVPFGSYSPITFGTKTKDNPLPVELLDFNANCLKTSANIHWQTASETNNDYFILERSNGVNEFYEIARLQGAGNSNILADYYFVDEKMFSGDNYYRLKQVDFDGKTTAFNIITLNCDGYAKEQAVMYAYPNPFKDELNVVIENMDAGEFTLEILDDLGRVVYLEKYTATSSEFKTSLNLNDLPPAVYNLRSKSKENVLNIRVVKK